MSYTCPVLWCIALALVGCGPQAAQTSSSVSEADALGIARRTLATNGGPTWLEANVSYRARREGRGWDVIATIIDGTNAAGEPIGPVGGHRIVLIDEQGTVTQIVRGR
jgi:hypothetical protein